MILHFPLCPDTCFGHGKIHSEYSITYDKRVALRPDATHIGAVLFNSPEVLEKLPPQYHKWLLLFNPMESQKLPYNKGCDHRIELKTAEENLRMGPIYQLTLVEERLLKENLDKMIREGKVRPSSRPIRSPIQLFPKPNGKGLSLCVDYRHLNQNTIKDKTPLPIMQELQDRLKGADFITKVDLKSGFHLIQLLLGYEKYTAFRTKFGLFEYTVMPFGLTNSPATFQREMNRILPPVLGIELGFNTEIHIDQDEGTVVVAYIDDIIIATNGSHEKHRCQVGKVFDLLLENQMCVEINKCVFEQTEASFLRFIVSGQSIRVDPAKAQDIVDWPRPKNQKEVQQILGLWNFYRRFIPNCAQIVAPIAGLLKGNGKDFTFGDTQETAVLKIVVLFTAGNTPILWHFDQDRPALIKTDASDFEIEADLSLKFEDWKIPPCAFLSQKLSSAEFNYEVFDKEMPAIVHAHQKSRHYVLGTEDKTTIFSDLQNLEYFTKKVKCNRRLARGTKCFSNSTSLKSIKRDHSIRKRIYHPGAWRTPLERKVQ